MCDITGDAADHADMGWAGGRDPDSPLRNARPIPARRSQRNCLVEVTARLVWDDGVELVETVATAHAGRDVLVQLDRPRQIRGVWLDASDVRRRPSAQQRE